MPIERQFRMRYCHIQIYWTFLGFLQSQEFSYIIVLNRFELISRNS